MKALLNDALHAFGLDGAEAVFLRHNENLTYRVADKYLLRIHRAAEGLCIEHSHPLREAELAFLRHLSAQGILVQQPIGTVTLADGTMATLLTWLDGQALTGETFGADTQRQVGQMTAQLHQAARGFHHPDMRRYDAALYLSMADELVEMAARHSLGSEHAAVFQAACKAVAQVIGGSANVTIHADLSQGNILLTPTGLAPIDFSLMGLGDPMLDLGILIASTRNAEEMQGILLGYGEGGGSVRQREMEAGFAAGLLGCFALHPDWAKDSWFREKLDRWERQILLPVAEGRPMFDSEMKFINP
ncbi:MAG: phosphotransferase enzyme family protein [Aristaeellaceae bacterium]